MLELHLKDVQEIIVDSNDHVILALPLVFAGFEDGTGVPEDLASRDLGHDAHLSDSRFSEKFLLKCRELFGKGLFPDSRGLDHQYLFLIKTRILALHEKDLPVGSKGRSKEEQGDDELEDDQGLPEIESPGIPSQPISDDLDGIVRGNGRDRIGP